MAACPAAAEAADSLSGTRVCTWDSRSRTVEAPRPWNSYSGEAPGSDESEGRSSANGGGAEAAVCPLELLAGRRRGAFSFVAGGRRGSFVAGGRRGSFVAGGRRVSFVAGGRRVSVVAEGRRVSFDVGGPAEAVRPDGIWRGGVRLDGGGWWAAGGR